MPICFGGTVPSTGTEKWTLCGCQCLHVGANTSTGAGGGKFSLSLQLLSAPTVALTRSPQLHTNTLTRTNTQTDIDILSGFIMSSHQATPDALVPCGGSLTHSVDTRKHTYTCVNMRSHTFTVCPSPILFLSLAPTHKNIHSQTEVESAFTQVLYFHTGLKYWHFHSNVLRIWCYINLSGRLLE